MDVYCLTLSWSITLVFSPISSALLVRPYTNLNLGSPDLYKIIEDARIWNKDVQDAYKSHGATFLIVALVFFFLTNIVALVLVNTSARFHVL